MDPIVFDHTDESTTLYIMEIDPQSTEINFRSVYAAIVNCDYLITATLKNDHPASPFFGNKKYKTSMAEEGVSIKETLVIDFSYCGVYFRHGLAILEKDPTKYLLMLCYNIGDTIDALNDYEELEYEDGILYNQRTGVSTTAIMDIIQLNLDKVYGLNGETSSLKALVDILSTQAIPVQ